MKMNMKMILISIFAIFYLSKLDTYPFDNSMKFYLLSPKEEKEFYDEDIKKYLQ